MPIIMRYKLTWGLPSGGPGVTTLFAMPDTTEQVFADAARAFLSDALNQATAHDSLPSGCTIQGEGIVDNIEVTDGTLTSAVPVTPPAVITGTGSGVYAAPVGACITWLTGLVHQGRRVRGRTFLVPLANSAFQNNGTLDTAWLTQVRNAATTYIAGAVNPAVWCRPDPGTTNGAAFSIAAGSVADKAAVLTSRRD
jgi:hypothetical protein